MLKLKGVTKVYQTGGVKRTVLKGINVDFRASEFTAILGPSGSGKTTLLNIIGGLDQYTKGDLIVNGKSTKKFKDKDWDAYRNHRIGFVFQSYNLIPHQTVLANVRLALTLSGISKKESNRRARHALHEVGLSDHLDKKPAQLSGGQMQRVAIARALVNDPDIVLADEPTGALDSETSIQIMDILKKVAQDRLVIMVTHNPELADRYANRIITLKDGEITSDSNPMVEDEVLAEDEKAGIRKRRRTKMSYLTALSLSLKNLLTKKARTILISIAGSIGIIGIALISAVSTGFQNYIDTIEKDTLTSYPLTLMEESTDITSVLLSVMDQGGEASGEQKVRENQELTGALGTVSHNDLNSFMNYLAAHRSDVDKDLKLVEKEYNVDPLIYTIDRSGKLAKLNPSNLFSSLIGESSLLNNYSSLTSVFQQQELENLQEESSLVAGRWPEKYDEIVISLRNPAQIPDLMTYSLGFHDTEKLNEILTKIMSGEVVSEKEEPLELSYDELMGVDLRLIPATATYRYNDKYSIYENMSEDADYMRGLFENDAERLKVVGIISPNGDMSSLSNGVYYLPDLITHIIEKAGETEIVKKQLANPDVDVFSNKTFGEADQQEFDFDVKDLVSVDSEAMKKALGVEIDQAAIEAKTREYMGSVMADIDTGVGSTVKVREAMVAKFKGMAEALEQKFKQKYQEEVVPKVTEIMGEIRRLSGELMSHPDQAEEIQKQIDEKRAEIPTVMSDFATKFVAEDVKNYVAATDFSDWEGQYGLPADSLREAYASLLQWYMGYYSAWYLEENVKEGAGSQAPGLGDGLGAIALVDPSGPVSMPTPEIPTDYTASQFLAENPQANTAFDELAAGVGKIYLTKTILTEISGLTGYLTSTFANTFHVDQDALTGAFHLNVSEDELSRVISTMFNQKEVSLATNLSDLGYQNLDEPTRIAFYFESFDGKTNFMSFLDNYNQQMQDSGQEDKVIEYSDTTGMLMSSVKVIVDAVSYVLIAFVSISLIVSSIMIGVITYISVYERTKEIGILRALGASKGNISSIFNAETMIIGFLAGVFGIAISYLLIPPINLVLHHFTGDIPLAAELAPITAVLLILLSVVLTIIGGLIPAHSASKKDPVEALRSE